MVGVILQLFLSSTSAFTAFSTLHIGRAIKKGSRGFKDTTNYEFCVPHAKQTCKFRENKIYIYLNCSVLSIIILKKMPEKIRNGRKGFVLFL